MQGIHNKKLIGYFCFCATVPNFSQDCLAFLLFLFKLVFIDKNLMAIISIF